MFIELVINLKTAKALALACRRRALKLEVGALRSKIEAVSKLRRGVH